MLEWREIAIVLADEDVMGITDGNPDPIGEYRNEAEAICRSLESRRRAGEEIDRDRVAEVVSAVFERWFEQTLASDDAGRIAARIIPA